MYDLDAIEAINADQLVTPLDRILLRNGRPARRPSRPTMDLTAAAAYAEKTVYMRAHKSTRGLVGAAAFAAFASLSVTLACLLA